MYKGVLGTGMGKGLAKAAYDSWRGQKERCNNPKNKAYKYYGAKGIRVKYGSREFTTWYLKQAKNRKYQSKLTVDRIDTFGHYEFSNIRLVYKAENTAESNRRTKAKPIRVFLAQSGLEILKCKSVQQVVELTGVCYKTIQKHCLGKYPKRGHRTYLTFKYET